MGDKGSNDKKTKKPATSTKKVDPAKLPPHLQPKQPPKTGK